MNYFTTSSRVHVRARVREHVYYTGRIHQYDELWVRRNSNSRIFSRFCNTSTSLQFDSSSSTVRFDALDDLQSDPFENLISCTTYRRRLLSNLTCPTTTITTTESFTSVPVRAYTVSSYSTRSPIISTAIHNPTSKPPDTSLKCFCQPASSLLSQQKKCEYCLVFKKKGSKNPKPKALTMSEYLNSLGGDYQLSEFETKYGLRTSIISKFDIDIKNWAPKFYVFTFPLSVFPHLPHYITVRQKTNAGNYIEDQMIPDYQYGLYARAKITLWHRKIHHYLNLLIFHFLSFHDPIKIIFPPYILIRAELLIVLNFQRNKITEKNHLKDDYEKIFWNKLKVFDPNAPKPLRVDIKTSQIPSVLHP